MRIRGLCADPMGWCRFYLVSMSSSFRIPTGTLVDPDTKRGTGPVVGLKVSGVGWLIGVDSVVAESELGGVGLVIWEGSDWLVDDTERNRKMKEGMT